MLPRLLTAAASLILLAACSMKREVLEDAPASEPRSAEQAAAELGNPLLANKGDINAITYNVTTSEQLEQVDNGSDEELIWTNPDNPDAEIPELTEAFENRRNGNGWQSDMGWAIRLARRQELPLLVWFHDSVISPKSNTLAKDYLNTKEFNDWCKDRLIRLRLDSGSSLNDSTADNAKYSYRQINALQLRYGLKKKPSFAIITPSGKIVSRIDGYDGYLSGFIRELQSGVHEAEREYEKHKAELRERGFRDWTSARSSKKVFAKFMRYDAEKKIVYLKEDGGRISRTKLSAFSPQDVDYILSLQPPQPARPHEQI